VCTVHEEVLLLDLLALISCMLRLMLLHHLVYPLPPV